MRYSILTVPVNTQLFLCQIPARMHKSCEGLSAPSGTNVSWRIVIWGFFYFLELSERSKKIAVENIVFSNIALYVVKNQ